MTSLRCSCASIATAVTILPPSSRWSVSQCTKICSNGDSPSHARGSSRDPKTNTRSGGGGESPSPALVRVPQTNSPILDARSGGRRLGDLLRRVGARRGQGLGQHPVHAAAASGALDALHHDRREG